MLQGFQFDKMQAYPTTDASLFSYLAGDRSFIIPNRGNELNVTTSELNITVDTGEALIEGRQIKITEPMVLTIGANQSGYLVIEIDLSKANTSTGTPGQADYEPINNQLLLKFVNNLTQDNINDGGLIYQFNLGTVSSTSNSITFVKNEKVDYSYCDLLFEGAVPPEENAVITLSESMKKYRLLVFLIHASSNGDPFGYGIYPILNKNEIPGNTPQSILFVDGVPHETNNVNTISIYAGRFSEQSETQLKTEVPIHNILLRQGLPIGGASEYYVRQVWGVR